MLSVRTMGGHPVPPSCPGAGGLLGAESSQSGPVWTAPGAGTRGCLRRLCPSSTTCMQMLAAAQVGPPGARPGECWGPWTCGVCRGPAGWAAVDSRAAQLHPVQRRPQWAAWVRSAETGRGAALPSRPPRLPTALAACLMPSPEPRWPAWRAGGLLCPRKRAGLRTSGWGWGRAPDLGGRQPLTPLCGPRGRSAGSLLSLMELASISRRWGGRCNRKLPPWPLYLASQNTGRRKPSRLCPNARQPAPQPGPEACGQAEGPPTHQHRVQHKLSTHLRACAGGSEWECPSLGVWNRET